MLAKYIFDRLMALIGLVALCWLYPIVALLIKIMAAMGLHGTVA